MGVGLLLGQWNYYKIRQWIQNILKKKNSYNSIAKKKKKTDLKMGREPE